MSAHGDVRSLIGAAAALALAVGLAVAAGGCVSLGAAPAQLAAEAGAIDPALAGTWTSRRTGSLGRVRMILELGCDGRYVARPRVFLLRLRERGAWWSEAGRLVFTRATGELTRWPYELAPAGDALRLEEAPGEVHVYRRATVAGAFEGCPGSAPAELEDEQPARGAGAQESAQPVAIERARQTGHAPSSARPSRSSTPAAYARR